MVYNCSDNHKRVTKALELLEGLEWLKNCEFNISFKQEPDGKCVIYSEDTGHKVTGDLGILKFVKNKLKKVTPEIIDLWG